VELPRSAAVTQLEQNGAHDEGSCASSGYPSVIDKSNPSKKETAMNLHLSIGPLVSLIAGILILMVPRLLNYIVAIYLILMGLLGLFGTGNLHL
jgi:Protein of unknown function (DUF3096)